jgi:hypothetical protein
MTAPAPPAAAAAPSPSDPARESDGVSDALSPGSKDLRAKRDKLQVEMMEMELQERREKLALQQAERAQRIKEREFELAERAARFKWPFNGVDSAMGAEASRQAHPSGPGHASTSGGGPGQTFNPTHQQPHQQPPAMAFAAPPRPSTPPSSFAAPKPRKKLSLQVSSEMAVSIAPDDGASHQMPNEGAAEAESSERLLQKEPLEDHDPMTDLPIPLDIGRGAVFEKVKQINEHKDAIKRSYVDQMTELEMKELEAAAEAEQRRRAAEKLAAQAMLEVRTSRVTEITKLIAASLTLVKKSSEALDGLVLRLVDVIEQNTAEDVGIIHEEEIDFDGKTVKSKLMDLVTQGYVPSQTQLDEAVEAVEAMRPRSERATVNTLQRDLANLKQVVEGLDEPNTTAQDAEVVQKETLQKEEDDAAALIAKAKALSARILREEAEATEREKAALQRTLDSLPPPSELSKLTMEDLAARDAPLADLAKKLAEDSQKAAAQAAAEDAALPVPPELITELQTLKGKKKYLQEIAELKAEVERLQNPPEEGGEGVGDGEGGEPAAA